MPVSRCRHDCRRPRYLLTSFYSIRRVKCGEERPSCLRCTSTGRQCDGYDVGRATNTGSRSLLPLDPPKAVSPVRMCVPGPATAVTLDENERSAFSHFVRETADGIRQLSPDEGWIQLALQLSHEAAPVTLAITALGCAHQAQLGITHTTLVQPLDPEHHYRAMRQYTKTLGSLQSYIDCAVLRTAHIEPVLLACLLLVCLEVMHGRGAAAISHLRSGRRIMNEHIALSSNAQHDQHGSLNSRSHKITLQLAGVLESLDASLNSLNCDDERSESLETQQCDDPKLLRHPPSWLTFSHETLLHLDDLIHTSEKVQAKLLRIAEAEMVAFGGSSLDFATRFCLAHCLTRDVSLKRHPQLQREIQTLVDSHELWRRAVVWLELHKQRPHLRRALIIRQLQQFFAFFALSTCRETEEALTDRFTNDFVQVLQIAEQYIEEITEIQGPRARSETPPGWEKPKMSSLQLGVLPAINLICFKCRHPVIRRRAISLLHRCNRQEGLFWSAALAAHAEAIQHIEERKAHESIGTQGERSTGLEGDATAVPEACRFSEVVLAPDPRGRSGSLRIVCARFIPQQRRQICLVEYGGSGYPISVEKVRETVLNLE